MNFHCPWISFPSVVSGLFRVNETEGIFPGGKRADRSAAFRSRIMLIVAFFARHHFSRLRLSSVSSRRQVLMDGEEGGRCRGSSTHAIFSLGDLQGTSSSISSSDSSASWSSDSWPGRCNVELVSMSGTGRMLGLRLPGGRESIFDRGKCWERRR